MAAIISYYQPCRSHLAQPARCFEEPDHQPASLNLRRRQFIERCHDVQNPHREARRREEPKNAPQTPIRRQLNVESGWSKVEEVRKKFEGVAAVSSFSRSFESPPRRRLADSLFASFKLPRKKEGMWQPRAMPQQQKRKSAVEMLAESKAYYVKSETVLDSKQELPLRMSSGLGQAIAAGGCHLVSSGMLNNDACCNPYATTTRNMGGCRRAVSAGEGLQNTLRRLLQNSDDVPAYTGHKMYAEPRRVKECYQEAPRSQHNSGTYSGTSSSGTSGSKAQRSDPEPRVKSGRPLSSGDARVFFPDTFVIPRRRPNQIQLKLTYSIPSCEWSPSQPERDVVVSGSGSSGDLVSPPAHYAHSAPRYTRYSKQATLVTMCAASCEWSPSQPERDVVVSGSGSSGDLVSPPAHYAHSAPRYTRYSKQATLVTMCAASCEWSPSQPERDVVVSGSGSSGDLVSPPAHYAHSAPRYTRYSKQATLVTMCAASCEWSPSQPERDVVVSGSGSSGDLVSPPAHYAHSAPRYTRYSKQATLVTMCAASCEWSPSQPERDVVVSGSGSSGDLVSPPAHYAHSAPRYTRYSKQATLVTMCAASCEWSPSQPERDVVVSGSGSSGDLVSPPAHYAHSAPRYTRYSKQATLVTMCAASCEWSPSQPERDVVVSGSGSSGDLVSPPAHYAHSAPRYTRYSKQATLVTMCAASCEWSPSQPERDVVVSGSGSSGDLVSPPAHYAHSAPRYTRYSKQATLVTMCAASCEWSPSQPERDVVVSGSGSSGDLVSPPAHYAHSAPRYTRYSKQATLVTMCAASCEWSPSQPERDVVVSGSGSSGDLVSPPAHYAHSAPRYTRYSKQATLVTMCAASCEWSPSQPERDVVVSGSGSSGDLVSPPAHYAHSAPRYTRSNSHSQPSMREEDDNININSHKSLPDLHTQARCYTDQTNPGPETIGRSPRRRRYSTHQRTASCSSKGTRSNHSSLMSCDAFSEHPSPGDENYQSYNSRCGSSFARDSGGSSGHYTQRSAPPHAPHNAPHRHDSGVSTHHDANGRYHYSRVEEVVVCAPAQFQDGAPSPPAHPPPHAHAHVGIHFQASAPPPQFSDEPTYEYQQYDCTYTPTHKCPTRNDYNTRERDYNNYRESTEVPSSGRRGRSDDHQEYVNTQQICSPEEMTSPLGTFKRQRCLRYKQRKPRPILRSKSDISDRYRRPSPPAPSPPSPPPASPRLHQFFSQLGLESRQYSALVGEQPEDSPVFFSSASTVDSNPRQTVDYTVQGPAGGAPPPAYRNLEPPSVVERNARIIKWLCQCRKTQMLQPQ